MHMLDIVDLLQGAHVLGIKVRSLIFIKELNPNLWPRTFAHMDEIHTNFGNILMDGNDTDVIDRFLTLFSWHYTNRNTKGKYHQAAESLALRYWAPIKHMHSY